MKIMKRVRQVFSCNFIKFGIVGVLNTLIGTSVMFICYNCFSMGYWLSSAMNYIIGSIFSYFANKYFTFKSTQQSVGEIIRFIVNISVCYFLAYGIAKKVVQYSMLECMGLLWDVSYVEQLSMIVGMVLFVILNYCGQKMFVFVKKKD